MKTIFEGLLAALLLLAAGLAQGQAIVQNNGDVPVTMSGGTAILGQSFVAPSSGDITAFGVRSLNAVTATLRIYNGGTGSGTPGVVGAPAYTQAGVALAAAPGGAVGPAGGFSNIPLTTPFAVTAGHTFTFQLTAAAPFSLAGLIGDPYPQGIAIFNHGQLPIVAHDLAFQVFMGGAGTATAAIPTLGEWALLALASAMVLLAAGRLRRRHPGPC